MSDSITWGKINSRILRELRNIVVMSVVIFIVVWLVHWISSKINPSSVETYRIEHRHSDGTVNIYNVDSNKVQVLDSIYIVDDKGDYVAILKGDITITVIKKEKGK
jgi:dipeptide/tripeptide permease